MSESRLSDWLWISRRPPKPSRPSKMRRAVRRAAHRRRIAVDDASFEVVRVTEGSTFVRHCQTFLPNPHLQARLDIPRMKVTVDGRPMENLEELLGEIPHSQSYVMAVLCTQTLFGPPYEIAMELMGASLGGQGQAVVCEDSPPKPGYIDIRSSRPREGPMVAQMVVATKTMRGGCIDAEGRFRPLCEICLSVDVDLLWDTNGAVAAARIVRKL